MLAAKVSVVLCLLVIASASPMQIQGYNWVPSQSGHGYNMQAQETSDYGQVASADGGQSFEAGDYGGGQSDYSGGQHDFGGNHGDFGGSSGHDFGDQGAFGGHGGHGGQSYASSIPLNEHVEVIQPVAETETKHSFVPIPKPFQFKVHSQIIVPVVKPYPIQVPVPKAVVIPVIKEVHVPVEKSVPYPVEKIVHYPVEKRVPFKVEKTIIVPVEKPVPFKVPYFQTIVHKGKSHH